MRYKRADVRSKIPTYNTLLKSYDLQHLLRSGALCSFCPGAMTNPLTPIRSLPRQLRRLQHRGPDLHPS